MKSSERKKDDFKFTIPINSNDDVARYHLFEVSDRLYVYMLNHINYSQRRISMKLKCTHTKQNFNRELRIS